ncbi:2-keto-3-deoxy-galactonokinase [Alsobacter soli]|uniref:2-keto-3-deoxy-galactonokinase n=1 Tax=Alsobacter soli TaxID=2109933 RepID=A0A2T1HPI2_9HYPH|nr:2-dehydro-3-deoxygalactonokinase [Alsobacter soli]PSC03536.1 2-keto-3-deoxy-galactonokinase [Alsobacter soli]
MRADQTALIALDWGTTRLRAYAVDGAGAVLERLSADEGIMAVPPGGFPETLRRHVGAWMERAPHAPVVMAGMVGSRNGWVEAPYLACPVSVDALARAFAEVPLGAGRIGHIVPGLTARDAAGPPDVMRGEETKIAGCGVTDGLVVMPGTHSKWARIRGGRIEGFSTFMTGDFYGALKDHTILGKLAEEPADPSGFSRGLAAARRPGGLTHLAFSARTLVLMGELAPAEVGPYLSGLLIGTEVDNGLAQAAPEDEIVLVADGVFATSYQAALADRGRSSRLVDPEDAVVAGLRRLVAARS